MALPAPRLFSADWKVMKGGRGVGLVLVSLCLLAGCDQSQTAPEKHELPAAPVVAPAVAPAPILLTNVKATVGRVVFVPAKAERYQDGEQCTTTARPPSRTCRPHYRYRVDPLRYDLVFVGAGGKAYVYSDLTNTVPWKDGQEACLVTDEQGRVLGAYGKGHESSEALACWSQPTQEWVP